MTGSPAPTPADMRELVSFLPVICAEGFRPVVRWSGGEKLAERAATMSFPVYDDAVVALFRTASRECWRDCDYRPDEARSMLMDRELVMRADIRALKTMLTYCVRGERFCEGHWAAMIDRGHMRRLLERVAGLLGEEGAG